MAKKDVEIQPVDYIRSCEWFDEETVEAYRFLLEADPNAPDYAERRAALADGFHSLWIYMRWCPVVYWAPTSLGSSSFCFLSFCLFILFMGFSRQQY